MTEEIGKYFSNTRKELSSLQQNLHTLHSSSKIAQDQNLNGIYGSIQNNVAKINQDLEVHLEDLFFKMMNNKNSTVMQLRQELNQTTQETGAAKFDRQANSAAVSTRTKQRPLASEGVDQRNLAIQGRSQSSAFFQNKRLNKKESFLPQFNEEPSKEADPLQKPFGKKFYKAKYMSQKNILKSKMERLALENELQEERRKAKQEKNEFLNQINNNDKEGLLEMLNKRKISKEIDLTSAFFGQGPSSIAAASQIKLSEFKEKHLKRIVSSASLASDLLGFKLEQPEQLLMQLPAAVPKTLATIPKPERRLKTINIYSATLGTNQTLPTPLKRENLSMQTLLHQQESNPFELAAMDAKSYPEVVDAYSLHRFLIRKGNVLEDTPEFQSFKRTFAKDWIFILIILRSLEKLMKQYEIQLATVDGKAVAALAMSRNGSPEIPELVSCCLATPGILKIIKVPSLLYRGDGGDERAATKIQSIWKRFKCAKEYSRLKILVQKVKLIQSYFRLFHNKKKTLLRIRQKNQDDLEYVRMLQMKLIEDWPVGRLKRRVEVHINTFSYDELKRLSMEKVLQRQNMQITRIFALKDPFVEVVYVSPYELSAEIVNYYYKILELGDVPDIRDRLHFISPEKSRDFPSHFPLSAVLLYSPRALKRLKALIKGKFAYIVPGYPSNGDVKLAKELDTPLLSGEPQQQLICSSKSGAKRVFQSCEVPTAPGAFEIYEEKELINTLAILILNNIRIDTWILKIEDETSSRGVAYFEVDSIQLLKKLRAQTTHIEVTQQLLYNLQGVLAQQLPNKLKLAVPSLYKRGYQEYLSLFLTHGGLIEASPTCPQEQISSPSIIFFIDPLGQISVIGSYDKINGSQYRAIGCSGPQQSLPNMNLEMMSQTIGSKLYARKVFGYITVDLIAFPDPSNSSAHPLFWAIGLDCFINNYTAACFYFYFLVKGKADPVNGECILDPQSNPLSHEEKSIVSASSLAKGVLPSFINETRSFVYMPYVQHQGLENLQFKSFFHLCRIESISFDLERRIGSAFILLDSLQCSLVGLITVAENQLTGIKYLNDTLKFLQKHLGSASDKFVQGNTDLRTDRIYFSDLMSRMKIILRKYDRVMNYAPKRSGSTYKDSVYL